MVLQNIKNSMQYTFELKDKLIRNREFDGWKEISLTSKQQLKENDESNEIAIQDLPAIIPLPGWLVY